MKTKANSTRVMTAILALLSMMIVFSIAAAPAFADGLADHIGYGKDVHMRLTDTDGMRQLLPALDIVIPDDLGADETDDHAVEPEPETFPDGGDWEPCFPEEPVPGDDGGDEVVPDEPAVDEDTDEAVDETDVPDDMVPGDAGGDEVVPEEPAVDEGTDEADVPEEPADETEDQEQQPEEPQQQSDEASTLPYTGGDSTPWFIAGVAIALAGAALLLRRREGSDRR